MIHSKKYILHWNAKYKYLFFSNKKVTLEIYIILYVSPQ